MGFHLVYLISCLSIFHIVSSVEDTYCTVNDALTSNSNCTKLCHCQEKLRCKNNTKYCLCDPGWMGDYCQYANIALSTNTQISPHNYSIQLNITYPVSAIRIIKNNETIQSPLKITVSMPDGKTDICCNYCSIKTKQQTNDVFCEYPITGKEIIIEAPSVSFIKEIQVFGGRNVALWQTAMQSSDYSVNATAGHAVDGYIGNRRMFEDVGKSCTHTKPGDRSEWNVTFSHYFDIAWVKIYNRQTLQTRLKFTLSFYDGENNTYIYRNYSGSLKNICIIDMGNSHMLPHKTNMIRIIKKSNQTSNDTSVLTLCEVEAFACRPIYDGSEICFDNCSDNCIGGRFCIGRKCRLCKPGHSGENCTIDGSKQDIYCTHRERMDARKLGYRDICTHLCHCIGDHECDVYTGKCSHGCDARWMGDNCQYENLAYQQNGGLLVDGNHSSCEEQQQNETSIDLTTPYPVPAVRLVLRGQTHTVISVQVLSENEWINCRNNVTTNTNYTDVVCSRIIRGQKIKILSGSIVQFCEVQVFGGRNVALWQNASQYSTDIEQYIAGLAIDGIKNFNDSCLTLSNWHPNENISWWNVMLERPLSVTRINLFLHGNYKLGRKGNLILKIGNDSDPSNIIFTHTNNTNLSIPIEVQKSLPQVFQNLQITFGGTNDLYVCEVEIYACVPDKTGEENCLSFCPDNCISTETCINYNFTCSTCKDGWMGDYCDKRITCSSDNDTIIISNNHKEYQIGDQVNISCAQGFILEGDPTIICTRDGNWSQGPHCKRIQCPTFNTTNINIDDMKIKNFSYGEKVTLSCVEGYTLTEHSLIKCTENGTWSREGPYCKISRMEAPSHDSSLGAVAGGTSAAVISLLIAVIITIIVLRRRNTGGRRKQDMNNENTNTYEMVNEPSVETKIKNTEYSNLNKGKLKEGMKEKSPYYNTNSVDQQQAKIARGKVYYDFTVPNKPSENAVHVSDFKDHVEERKHNDDKLTDEFSKLKSGLQYPTEAALRPANTVKNKYRNIYPYDITRVQLLDTGVPDSDYINASHIHGYGKVNSYIASQGPLKETLDDFWRMVWQENVRKILMLTNLLEERKVKCVQYWPEDREELQFGELKIKIIDIEQYADFVIRVLSLKNSEGSRTVKQFHFTAWPDKGVPSYASSLVHFRTKVINTPMPGAGPIVVHCSAGIGRTGTFIALDYLSKQAKETDYIDVFGCVETLRRQRMNMVQTQEQYMFLHHALLETLMCPTSATSTKDFIRIYSELLETDPTSNKQKLQLEFETLNSTSPLVPDTEFLPGKDSTCRKKNRYSNILPVDFSRPFLPAASTDNQYINAVYLSAYREKNAFIVTQMPLKETVADFWRLVDDKDVSTVVMLNTLENPDGKNIGEYWLDDGRTASFDEYEIAVHNTATDADGDYEVVNLAYSREGREKKHVRIFKALFWPEDCKVPTLIRALLKLIETADMHRLRQRSGPMVVHCMNGCDKSGLFCVLHVVLERLKLEQDVGIQQIIKQMRSIRPQIIPNFEQFQFCHEVVLEFMKQYDDYSNFQ